MKANELKKGTVIRVDGQKILVKRIQIQTSSSRSGNTLYKVTGQDVVSRRKFERSYKGADNIEAVDFLRRSVQLLFREADSCTFMDSGNYEQYQVDSAVLEEELCYLVDGSEGISALIADGNLIGIEVPATITLQIVECSPGIKGASASARSKPAILSTGLVVQVPEYLSVGDNIKINTETATFMSRV